jgi:adenylate kinase family enzyme
MNAHLQSKPNPFSTRFVRPGAIAFQCHDGHSLTTLIDEFLNRWHGRASIIGPHGSGKSTLVAGLAELLAQRFEVFAYRFSTTDRNFASIWRSYRQWGPQCVVMVDGYEQLPIWSQWRLAVTVRSTQAKLLITAHRRTLWLPVLWRTEIDEEVAIRIRDQLLTSHPELLTTADVEEAWREARKAFPSDLRETLMSMYDWAEEVKQKRLASHDNSRAV